MLMSRYFLSCKNSFETVGWIIFIFLIWSYLKCLKIKMSVHKQILVLQCTNIPEIKRDANKQKLKSQIAKKYLFDTQN